MICSSSSSSNNNIHRDRGLNVIDEWSSDWSTDHIRDLLIIDISLFCGGVWSSAPLVRWLVLLFLGGNEQGFFKVELRIKSLSRWSRVRFEVLDSESLNLTRMNSTILESEAVSVESALTGELESNSNKKTPILQMLTEIQVDWISKFGTGIEDGKDEIWFELSKKIQNYHNFYLVLFLKKNEFCKY